jgi:protein tyrosine phosphatase type 4A
MTTFTHIKKQGLRFIVTNSPNNDNIDAYIYKLKKYPIAGIIRCCNITYSDTKLKESFPVCDLIFEDGTIPSSEIISKWIDIVKQAEKTNSNIAIHCTAGLGRAPLLVCLAFIIYKNYDVYKTIKLIRDKIPGALNSIQVDYLYKIKIKNSMCVIL